jgi:hypothetical protein
MVGRGRGVGGGSSVVTTSGGGGVLGLSRVGHISNIAVVVVSVVVHSLDPAVGKVDRVGAGNNTVTIVVLLLVEGSLGVVISHGVGEGVGAGLGEVVSNVSSLHGGVVGWGSVGNNGGVVSWGGMGNNGGVVSGGGMGNNGGVVGGGVSNDWGSVVGGGGVVDGVDTVRNNSISSVKSVGGISDDSGVSTEGLALGGGPVLSLVGLAH